MKPKRIGFIGNFTVPWTTENDRKWSFEKLGHEVVVFQENKTTAEELLLKHQELDVLFYSHTHDPSYVIGGLKEVFAKYKEWGIPTVSAHLDLWRGLERWFDVGNEATWSAEFVFTPDDTGEWPEGINHHFMRPGVKEISCYIAQPDRMRFPHEIVFVGSDGYHKEYSERPQLIRWLKNTYGNRFGHYGGSGYPGLRGHDLNVLYSSAKIVIGDSCFSQSTPIKNYQSDRTMETMGRGGFYMHPRVDHLEDFPGIVLWDDLGDLKNKIDYWLKPENESDREIKSLVGFEYVKKNHTYTKIAQEMLEIIFKDS